MIDKDADQIADAGSSETIETRLEKASEDGQDDHPVRFPLPSTRSISADMSGMIRQFPSSILRFRPARAFGRGTGVRAIFPVEAEIPHMIRITGP